MKDFLKFAVIGLIALLSITSCTEDEEALSSDSITEEAELLIARSTQETASGRMGCFELVFPIVINHPDGTDVEVMSWQEAREAMIAWRTDNPDVVGRSELQYPVELILQDGALVTVDTRTEIVQLRRECRRERIEDRRGERCFTLVFPIEVAFPDDTVASYDDRRSVKQGLRQWRRDNRGSVDRPSLVFPLTIELEDGEVVDVASKAELAAIKEACSE